MVTEAGHPALDDEIDDGNLPIVVGVNHSVAARAAASWAAVEARDRSIPVRLVAVIATDYERNQAADSLRYARAAVETVAPAVCIVEVIRSGEWSDVLVSESASAAMVCVGTRHQIGASLDSAVTAVVERAQCAVAVIRPAGFTGPMNTGVVSVVLDDTPDNDTVVATAMREGRLRNAVVRQVDHRVDSWVRRFPDVAVEIVADGAGRLPRGARGGVRPQLAVMPQTEGKRLAGAMSPCYHPITGYPDYSMLFVPTDRSRRHRERIERPYHGSEDPT